MRMIYKTDEKRVLPAIREYVDKAEVGEVIPMIKLAVHNFTRTLTIARCLNILDEEGRVTPFCRYLCTTPKCGYQIDWDQLGDIPKQFVCPRCGVVHRDFLEMVQVYYKKVK